MADAYATWVVAFVRKVVFTSNAGGIYAVAGGGLRGFALSVVKGVLQWPDGSLSQNAAKTLLAENHIAGHVSDLLFLAGNAYLWIALGVALIYLLRLMRKGDAEAMPLLALGVWLAGSLSFGVLVGAHPRFGGSIFPLEVLFLLAVARQATRGRVHAILVSGVSVLAAVFVVFACQRLSAAPRQPESDMNDLVTELQRLGDGGGVIYVVSGPGSFSNPEAIGWYAGIRRKLVIVNQYEGCRRSSEPASLQVLPIGDGQIALHHKLPACARLLFNSAQPVYLLPALQPAGAARGNWARYRLPDTTVGAKSVRNEGAINMEFGHVLDVTLTVAPSDSVVDYDWQTGTYRCSLGACHG